MANDLFHTMADRTSGKLGHVVYERVAGVRTAKYERRIRKDREPTEAETAAKTRFIRATEYAKGALADPAVRPLYTEAGRRGPYTAAVADWFNPPKVEAVVVDEYLGSPGNPITVLALDDVKVVSVRIRIRRASDGSLIESGPATAVGNHWKYAATTEVPDGETVIVEATARDLPGNTGTRSAEVIVNREE